MYWRHILMNDDIIVAISAGLKQPKKDYNALNTKNLYLNYGLLGLSTILKDKGYKIKMFQGDYYKPTEIIEMIKESGINLDRIKYPILLSIPSYFAIPWVKELCENLKYNYNVKIVAGGRWVVGKDEAWLKSRIPEIDLVLCGLGDYIIEKAVNTFLWQDINNFQLINNKNTMPFDHLDFSLLHNYLDYQPCIEVSRGCGRGCIFCMEKNIPLTKIKSPEHIIKEIKDIINIYKSEDINIYFEASFFKPNLDWARKLKYLYQKERLNIKWRCETRVDSITPEIIEELSYAGLKVIDLGLESASIRQLIAMGKTRKPEEYLEKARELVTTCKKFGIWVKVNILLFAGETLETVEETKNWLRKYSDCIKGVSVNPLVLYGYDANIECFKPMGVKLIKDNSIKENGYAYIDLSSEIDYQLSISLSMEISRYFMKVNDYFELKKFSYFPRSYPYNEYLKDINNINKDKLPFNL
ncbi:MAG: radical SAM protein [Clostridiaceae bacterium]|nr:radical SAM protein [Clostridiaceae bacterium]